MCVCVCIYIYIFTRTWRRGAPWRRARRRRRRSSWRRRARRRPSAGPRRGPSRARSASRGHLARARCSCTCWARPTGGEGAGLAVTRYSFTSKLLCTSESSLSCPSPSALLTLLQYYSTTIAQYTISPQPPFCMPYTTTPLLYAIYYTQLVQAISCKGQRGG